MEFNFIQNWNFTLDVSWSPKEDSNFRPYNLKTKLELNMLLPGQKTYFPSVFFFFFFFDFSKFYR